MSDTYIQANTDGTGKKIRTVDRTISSQVVHEEVQQLGESQLPSYFVTSTGTSLATAASHILQLMAGSALHVRVRRVTFVQLLNASTGATVNFEIRRLTTAGTGGTARTPAAFDTTTDGASGATAMTLPSAKGTEGVAVGEGTLALRQTAATSGSQVDDNWDWTQMPNQKPIIIPAGTSNGIALKVIGGNAGATGIVTIEFTETAWL